MKCRLRYATFLSLGEGLKAFGLTLVLIALSSCTVNVKIPSLPSARPGTDASPALLSIISHSSPYDFGNVLVGGAASVTFTLSNSGGLSASSISLSGLSAPVTRDVGVASNCGTTLAAGASCSIKLDYSPNSATSMAQTLSVAYIDGAGGSSSFDFDLTGEGVTGANLTISPSSYDFGARVIGGSPIQSFTVTNTGILDATGISFTNFNSVFQNTGTGDCGATLAVSASCTLVVSFTPTAVTSYSRTISITYSDSGATAGNTTLSLSGQGENGTPFVSVWQTSSPSESITLPLRSGYQYNFTVDWGDGSPISTVTSDADPDITHVYASSGTFNVTITGYAEAWHFGSSGTTSQIIQVVDFGNLGWINLQEAFSGCDNLTSFAGGVTTHVTNMSSMFYNAQSLTSLDLSSFNTTNVTDMSFMFYTAQSLTSLDLSSFNTTNVTDMSFMFHNAQSLTSLDLSSFNTTNVTDMTEMFLNAYSLTSLDLSNFNTQSVTSMYGMFYGMTGLTSLDLSSFDTQNVTNMGFMFSSATGLTSLDLSSFNTQNVTDMSFIFSGASGLTSVDLSSFNTESVTNMSYMFYNTVGLTSLDLSNFNTQNVTNMNSMFQGASALTSLDLSSFNTQNVNYMIGIFSGATGLTNLDVSSFDTRSVMDMSGMFANMTSLTSLDLSHFNTQSVLNMSEMFANSSGLTSLDLSNFDTRFVINMSGMFQGTTNLTSLNTMNWDISPPPVSTDIFLNSNPTLVVRCDQGGSPGTGSLFGKACAP